MLPRALTMSIFLTGSVWPVLLPLWTLALPVLTLAWWWRSGWLILLFLIGSGITVWTVVEVNHKRTLAPQVLFNQPVQIERCWQSDWGSRCLLRSQGQARFFLNWQAHEPPVPGLRGFANLELSPWQATVQPGQSSFALWLLRHRVQASGTLKSFQSEPLPPLANLQFQVREQLRSRAVSQRARGFYEALVMGDRSQLDATVRGQVARTQTQHLLALSGLHIGSLALWSYWLAGWVWQLYPKGVKQDWQKCAALGMAALLLWVALPAVSLWRAFLMTAIPGIAWLLRNQISFPRLLLCIGCLMVLADPLIWLDLGAWFSWWATLLLLMLVVQIKHWAGWQQLVVIQLCLSVLLLPIHALWQLPMFPSGMVLNLMLIPWVSFVSLPLAFLTGLGIPGAAWLFSWTTEVWRFLLAMFDHLVLFLPNLPPLISIVVGALAAWGLVTAWRVQYWLVWILFTFLLMILSLQSPRYHDSEYGVWVLDSGRGQTVIIETSEGRVLVDLGAGTGQRVQLEQGIMRWHLQAPFSHWHTVVLTRPGRSTQGGLATLASLHKPPQQAFSSRPLDTWPEPWPEPQFCSGEVQWQLGGVQFQFVRPHVHYQPTSPYSGACVLEVSSPAGRTLLLSAIPLPTLVALEQLQPLQTPDLVVSQGPNSFAHQRFVTAQKPAFWVIQSASAPESSSLFQATTQVCTCGRHSIYVGMTQRSHKLRNTGLHLLPWLKLS